MKNFGGPWTEAKLDAFIKYVKAYLTILNKYKNKYGWQTIYFDGFAGFGKRIKEINIYNGNYLFDKGKFVDKYKSKLENFFGLPMDRIEMELFPVKQTNTLWGNLARKQKIKNPIEQIVRLYVLKVIKI